ncbi:hypothetical protein V8B55DRAFT_1452978 [Mucor lusitanicus]|uniref:Uncharacterized protein n=2 Tax=Mucor circinelloides f. lusitanicus TaxID=29924 RepID=A0A168JVD7_MUCCL|nr:hypothetical protein FB192DRAFT_1348343 [Mucor lusitanicus]OAD01663.1 hypothetical protein MUCCIDRAFT_111004 [Mucor lusitanicus CBS 277.49]
MATVTTTTAAAAAPAVSESRYKSFMKPVKFWSKSSPSQQQQQKESSIDDLINRDYMSQNGIPQPETAERPQPVPQQQQPAKSGYLSSFHFSRKSSNQSNNASAPVVALTESGKSEVYKLSTIDDAGVYMPPSPSISGKRDHWIEVNEDDMMDFHLPDSACLTTHVGEKHDFYTPSTFVQSQPYILPIPNMSESTLSSVPSLDDGHSDLTTTSSCRSSASYL